MLIINLDGLDWTLINLGKISELTPNPTQQEKGQDHPIELPFSKVSAKYYKETYNSNQWMPSAAVQFFSLDIG